MIHLLATKPLKDQKECVMFNDKEETSTNQEQRGKKTNHIPALHHVIPTSPGHSQRRVGLSLDFDLVNFSK